VGRSTRVEEKLGAMEKEKQQAAVQAPVEKKPDAPKAEKKPEPAAPAK
jgi:hypothetical protein